ncbi:transposase [Paraburkholderia sacchari]
MTSKSASHLTASPTIAAATSSFVSAGPIVPVVVFPDYLRTLLFQGARSAILTAHRRDDRLSRWIVQLHARIGYYKTLVAVANKPARILWAVLARDERFDSSHAPARNAMAAADA